MTAAFGVGCYRAMDIFVVEKAREHWEMGIEAKRQIA
jgi:hypothetical protein